MYRSSGMVNVVVGPRVPYGASNWPTGEAGSPRNGGGGGRVPDVQQERGPAHSRAVHPAGVDAKRVRDLDGAGRGDGRDPVDVLHGEARVGHRVTRRLDVQPQRGMPGQPADLIRLRGTRDDDARAAHGLSSALLPGAGVKTGSAMSPRRSKATRSGMSSTRT